MKERVILDLCGGTGSWSKPYKNAGYDVRLYTMPHKDITLPLVQMECINCNPYGILAAPPCTEFSLAKNNTPRNFKKGMELVKICLEIIWSCRYNGELKFWALENPRCFTRQFLGKPVFTFEHWEFGDKGIKPTDLWGYFNKPKKTFKEKPMGMSQKFPNGRINARGWSKSSEKRAVTPPGFAKAFFEANR